MKFRTYTMEDALEQIIDYRGKTPKKSDSGIPTLSAKSVKNNHIDYSLCYYISPDEYDRFMVRGFPKVGDVLLTTEAPMGMVARLDRDDVGIAQRLLTLRGKQDILDNEYLLYFLQSSIGQSLLKARETGTTVTGIKQAEFRKIQIDIPEIHIQKKIGGILRILDQKIKPNEGTLLCRGSIAAIYETTGILESMTLGEQIALPLLCQGYSRREAMDHALEWLKKIGEEIRGYHKEDRITAYDRALIAVGQAVLQNPDLIAADTFMTDLNRAEQARILKILDEASKARACLLMADEIPCGFPCDRILELRKPMDRQPADNMSWT